MSSSLQSSNMKGNDRPNTNNKSEPSRLFFSGPPLATWRPWFIRHGQRTEACDGGNICAATQPDMEIPRHSMSQMPATRGRGAPGRRRILDWTDDGDEFVRTPRVSRNGSRPGRGLHADGAGRQAVPVRLCPRRTPPCKEDAERSGLARRGYDPGWSANEIPSGVDGK
jgi:hypothetical protein